MSRRLHTTDLGCIACDALTDLGAGKEGWLVDNPDLLISLDTHSVAFANRSLILILHWSSSNNGGPDPDKNRVIKIRPDLSPIESEYISAVEWLVFDDEVSSVLAVGTSCGYLLIYSLHGILIHKQIVNTGKILKLRVRGTKRDLTEDTSSEEVCVVMPGVIARFEGSDIQNMLQRWFQGTDSQSWNDSLDKIDLENSESSFTRLPYQLWNVSKYGPCSDAAITGVMPPPLMEIQGLGADEAFFLLGPLWLLILSLLLLASNLAFSWSPCLFDTLGPCPCPGLNSPWLSTFNDAG
ncbi:rab3 GTPase-activating non-catalytic subunit [Olea europaea subsp. europaea]|uniref:Rab3 GTPase-activating non-catalytic subunit n=1 Tax=Olea europaea subsp. europaea TaxID=158383 RepID=A0A8S0QLY9_OLEEU|nr:rab3 GTPase-activating non-catalytic subunit [Olea europaea subsp. europaea]